MSTGSKVKATKKAAIGRAGLSSTILHTPSDTPLLQFLQTVPSVLTLDERQLIVDQAIALLEGFNPHLPLKKTIYTVDPVQQLRLLRLHLPAVASDWDFHSQMRRIFLSVHDLHTNYSLPPPFSKVAANLPFRIESCMDKGQDTVVVSGISGVVAHPLFKRGVVVTHWNGVPMERALEIAGSRSNGTAPFVRRWIALMGLTSRSLGGSAPPDEAWTVVRFLAEDGVAHEASFSWSVTGLPEALHSDFGPVAQSPHAAFVAESLAVQAVRKQQFAPQAVANAPDNASDKFSSRTIESASGTFGYIRIWTFLTDYMDWRGQVRLDDDRFVDAFTALLKTMPKAGLILDLRDNGGGLCTAAERILQTLTPRTITSMGHQWRCSPATQLLVTTNGRKDADNDLSRWVPSVSRAMETGALLSAPFPITRLDQVNNIGQVYHGPVVLLTSAGSLSAAETFAAGFQDHEIGLILGVHPSTGGAGANVWTLLSLRGEMSVDENPVMGCPLVPLPQGVAMRTSVRRMVRVGKHAGLEVEDIGVASDQVHEMTRRDLLEGNVDLIEAAGKLLAQMPRQSLKAQAMAYDIVTQITVQTTGLDRLDFYANDRPAASLDVKDGAAELQIPSNTRLGAVSIKGFRQGTVVAGLTLSLKQETWMAPHLRSPDYLLRIANIGWDFDKAVINFELTTRNVDRLEIKAGSWDRMDSTAVAVQDGVNAVIAKRSSGNSSQSMTILAFQGGLQVGSQEINISPGFDPNPILEDYYKLLDL